MTPAASLLNSADCFMRAGKCQSATFARRMAEAATVWPELHRHFARQLRERADQIERKDANHGN